MTKLRSRGATAALLAALMALALATGPAHAATEVDVSIGSPGDVLVVKGAVDLRSGERADTVAIVDGPVTIARGATVTGDLFSVDGDVRIDGTVRGRVVTIGGRARVGGTGIVGDGIRYVESKPIVAPGASVGGTIERLELDFGGATPFVSWLAWWLAVGVSTLVFGLLALWLAPRAADATFTRMRDGGWGPAIGIGFVVFIGLPVLAFIALVTLVGIPLGIGLLLALLPLGALGYVTCAWALGRALVGSPRGRAVAFLAGWGVLRIVALVPVLGALVFLVAVMFGLGALTWAIWQARGEGAGPSAPLAPAGGPEAPTAPTI